jgi:dTDP-4-dehydrorhamnose 3,5-epimerase
MGVIDGVIITPLKIITGAAGNVLHAMKQADEGYHGFGEAYFSTVNHAQAKGWKRHREMTLNIIVPSGEILFVLYDGRVQSSTAGQIQEVTLGPENYCRMTVPPGIWMGFKGISKDVNLLLNIASIPHDPAEADSLTLENEIIPYTF